MAWWGKARNGMAGRGKVGGDGGQSRSRRITSGRNMQSKSFTKLFASITDSSIWGEDDATRIVWITMLAMADAHGYVGASIPGLAARARKSIAEVETALAKFKAPDAYSRTRDYEGRRIADADGGWLLLNYAKHREVTRGESVRQSKREWAQRARDSARGSGDAGATSPEVEFECLLVEQSRTESKSPSASTSGSDLDLDPDPTRARDAGVFDAPTIAVDPKRGNVAPDDFAPTEAHRVRCAELKLDVDALLREFKLFEFNRPYSDWGRRFSRWIEDARVRAETERAKASSGAAKGPRSGFQARGVLPALEPSAAHRRFAQHHSLDLDAIVADIERKGLPETLGMGRAREILGETLSKAARARARSASVGAQ